MQTLAEPKSPAGQAPGDAARPAALALGLLAAWLVSRGVPVWRDNPEMGHGWLVPLLALLLLRERWGDRPAWAPERDGDGRARRMAWVWFVPAGLALAGARLFLEPFPQWPVLLWGFALLCGGVMFALTAAAGGRRFAGHFFMPLIFLLTALPWPGVIDRELILPLRAVLASVAAEVAGWLGHPALARGTVVEIGRGLVGVDEACSGVRSLQTAVAVGLFLGELYRMRLRSRLGLLAAAIGVALFTNLARTVFLCLQAAWHGPAGVERWHDTAGTVQLVACLGGIVLVSRLWREGPARGPALPLATPAGGRPRGSLRLSLACVGLVVAAEAGTRLWFAFGERRQDQQAAWSLRLPADADTYRAEPFTRSMQELLGCDEHELGRWRAPDGTARAAYVLEWNKGQTARHAPALHDPTVCLPMSGSALLAEHGAVEVRLGGLVLPFRAYTFTREGAPYHVFYLAWDLTAGRPLRRGAEIDRPFEWELQQWEEVRAARRHIRARVLGVAIHGAQDLAGARAALEREFGPLVRMEPAGR